MAMTVITISNVPMSLRGDLTKWMQEIATGVYIGDLNPRVREELWKRVIQSTGKHGQATLSYAIRNELGYQFRTHQTRQINVSFDGIPLVMIPKEEEHIAAGLKPGFSNQAKFRRARKYTSKKNKKTPITPYIVIDIETNGLDPLQDDIIEIAAIRIGADNYEEFNYLISNDRTLPDEIVKLTGITDQVLAKDGQDISKVLDGFVNFIGHLPVVGYNVFFDIDFINSNLRDINKDTIKNRKIDLMGLVKKEMMFLKSYKLKDVLPAYGINDPVLHRALEDARLTHTLSTQVNGFEGQLNRKP
ncbi:MAG TPA: type I-E CRISPR-associated endoribonuclease Cas2e [Thermoclostridium sp.]|nr:type I-E CRISPR-associated endoribonuclease Cas2e [Thermoclostridium sp.]